MKHHSDRYTSVHRHLAPLEVPLADPDVTEIAINGPNEVFVERHGLWSRFEAHDQLSAESLRALGVAIARATDQIWDAQHPLLSASVPQQPDPHGATNLRELRFQLVAPPAIAAERCSVTIRKPAAIERRLDDFAQAGLFDQIRDATAIRHDADDELTGLLARKRYREFLQLAVRAKKNVVVAGATGSGKTTFMKGLVHEIPLTERLVTIEDVRELTLPHANKVHLLYSKGSQSSNGVTPKDLLECCLRMKPDRILLAELRGDECLYYVRNAASGHPGSITSVHAGSPALAFEQLAIMIKDSQGGSFLDFAVVKRLLFLTVDVIIQFQVANGRRYISEIYFDPQRKRAAGE